MAKAKISRENRIKSEIEGLIGSEQYHAQEIRILLEKKAKLYKELSRIKSTEGHKPRGKNEH